MSAPHPSDLRSVPETQTEFKSRKLTAALWAVFFSLLALVAFLWTTVYQISVVDSFIQLQATDIDQSYEFSIYGTTAGKLLKQPTAIDISALGELFVADSKDRCVYVYDAEGNYSRTIGATKDKRFKLVKPISVAVASNGQLFVVDATTQSLVIYDENEKPIRTVGFEEEQPLEVSVGLNEKKQEIIYVTTKSGIALGSLSGTFYAGRFDWGRKAGQFDAPQSVIAQANNNTVMLYVVDSLNYRVQAISSFESTPTTYWTYGQPLPSNVALRYQDARRKFGLPVAATLGSDGQLYVLDGLSGQIVVVDTENGSLHDVISSAGSMDGQLSYPEDIADYNGRIYVADSGNKRISVFSEESQFVPEKEAEPSALLGWLLVLVLGALAAWHIAIMLSVKRQRIIVDAEILEHLAMPEEAHRFSVLVDTIDIPLGLGVFAPHVAAPLSVRVTAVSPRILEHFLKVGEELDAGDIELLALAHQHRHAILVTNRADMRLSAARHKVEACSYADALMPVEVIESIEQDDVQEPGE